MKSITRVFLYELQRHGRRRGYLFMTIGIPLIAIALFYGAQAIQRVQQSTPGSSVTPSNVSKQLSDNRPTGLVDQSGLITPDVNTGGLIRYADAAAANTALEADEIGAYYIIPANYLTSGNVELWMARFSISNIERGPLSQTLVGALLKQVNTLDPAALARLTEKTPSITNHRLSETNQLSQSAGEGASFLLVYGFAIMFMFTTFLTSGLLMQSVIEEKENRMVEVLMSSMRPSELLAGKVLALGLLGLIQVGCWGLAAWFLLSKIAAVVPDLIGLKITPEQLALALPFFILGYLMFAAVYAGIGAISNSMREGPQMATFFTLPALIPVYLTQIFASQPDGNLAVGLSLFPITAPVAMIMRIAIAPIPAWQIAASLLGLLLTGIAFMWLAGRVFRLMTLVSGQPLKLGDLPKLIRENA